VHVVDRFGLADPLLARLPADVGDDWRVGHLERPLPRGYLGSVRSWRTGVVDPDVAALDRTVRTVTRGRLFAPERWHAIVDLNFP
jgi:arabinofuranosyltransferase